MGMITSEQLQLGIILEERMVKPSVSKLKAQVSFECGSWKDPLKNSLLTKWELLILSWCPNPNSGLKWELTADIELEESDDESLHDLARIHHLLALKVKKQSENTPTEPSEGNFPSEWMKSGNCLAASCGWKGIVERVIAWKLWPSNIAS